MYNSANYKKLLQSLLPKGRAWNRIPGSNLTEVLEGEALEFVRIDERSEDLIKENDTRKTFELLNEHEDDFDLPDECTDPAETITERRNVLHTKLITLGQQDKQYFIDLATALGYTVTITEWTPAWVGHVAVGENVGDQNIIFHWTVNAEYGAETIYLKVGAGAVGDPLVRYPALALLECTTEKLKPGHTIVHFVYTGPEYGQGFDNSFDAVPSEEEDHLEGAFHIAFSKAFDVKYGGSFERSFGDGFDRRY